MILELQLNDAFSPHCLSETPEASESERGACTPRCVRPSLGGTWTPHVCVSIKQGRGRLSAGLLLFSALTRDVHMMCVGSVRAVVGSSPIPAGRASKCFFKKASIASKAVGCVKRLQREQEQCRNDDRFLFNIKLLFWLVLRRDCATSPRRKHLSATTLFIHTESCERVMTQ